MIKKILLILLISGFLCGCNVQSDYIEPEDRLIVTTIGIDKTPCEFLLTLETADVISNTNEDIYKADLIKGSGPSLKAALNDISSKSYGRLIFSQCPVVMIGHSVSRDGIEQLLDFCVEEHEITFAISPVACESAFDILNSQDEKDKLIGYEIFKLLKFGRSSVGITDYDPLTRILNGSEEQDTYKIPRLIVTDKRINICGCTLYKNNEILYNMGLFEAQILYALNGELANCSINIGKSNLDIIRTCYKKNELLLYYKNVSEIMDEGSIERVFDDRMRKMANYAQINDFLPESANLKNMKIKIIGEY